MSTLVWVIAAICAFGIGVIGGICWALWRFGKGLRF